MAPDVAGPRPVGHPTETPEESGASNEPTDPALANAVANADAIELALAAALTKATLAGEWNVVSQLARELEARRTARAAGNVVAFARRRDRA